MSPNLRTRKCSHVLLKMTIIIYMSSSIATFNSKINKYINYKDIKISSTIPVTSEKAARSLVECGRFLDSGRYCVAVYDSMIAICQLYNSSCCLSDNETSPGALVIRRDLTGWYGLFLLCNYFIVFDLFSPFFLISHCIVILKETLFACYMLHV